MSTVWGSDLTGSCTEYTQPVWAVVVGTEHQAPDKLGEQLFAVTYSCVYIYMWLVLLVVFISRQELQKPPDTIYLSIHLLCHIHSHDIIHMRCSLMAHSSHTYMRYTEDKYTYISFQDYYQGTYKPYMIMITINY